MEIEIGREARKVLRRLQPAKAQDIREAIDRVAADPNLPHNNLRTPAGVPNGFRVRVGTGAYRARSIDRRTGDDL